MPFPTVEAVRKAVEKQLHEGLEADSYDWVATLNDGRKFEFNPSKNGKIEVEFCLPDEELYKLGEDEPAEKTYKFRIVVVSVE